MWSCFRELVEVYEDRNTAGGCPQSVEVLLQGQRGGDWRHLFVWMQFRPRKEWGGGRRLKLPSFLQILPFFSPYSHQQCLSPSCLQSLYGSPLPMGWRSSTSLWQDPGSTGLSSHPLLLSPHEQYILDRVVHHFRNIDFLWVLPMPASFPGGPSYLVRYYSRCRTQSTAHLPLSPGSHHHLHLCWICSSIPGSLEFLSSQELGWEGWLSRHLITGSLRTGPRSYPLVHLPPRARARESW